MNDNIKRILVKKRGSLQGGSSHKLSIVPNAFKDGAVMDETVLFKRVAVCRSLRSFLFLYMSKKFYADRGRVISSVSVL